MSSDNKEDLYIRTEDEDPNFPISKQVQHLLDLPYYTQRSPSWFAQRKDKLTASVIDTLLGRNPYEEPIDVLFKKCGMQKPFNGNKFTEHGCKFEDDAIALYCHKYNKKNYSFGLIPFQKKGKFEDDERYYFLGGSPDDVAVYHKDDPNRTEGIVIEVKCPYSRKIVMGEVPHHYLSQVLINMEICGLEEAAFIEYKPSARAMEEGTTFKDIHEPDSGNFVLNVVDIKRDPEWFPSVYPKLKKVWDEVEHYRRVGIDKHPYYNYMHRKIREPRVMSFVRNLIVDEDNDEELPEHIIRENLERKKPTQMKPMIIDESESETDDN
jgi:putative phage-type endonuclease